MGLNTWIRERVLNKITPVPGILAVPTDNEEFPSLIANEAMGGMHAYRTLEELADVPKDRLVNPMMAIVKEHLRPDTSTYPTTLLKFDPSNALWTTFLNTVDYNKISDIPGYNINDYWKIPIEPVPGPPGAIGKVGWSPVISLITRGSDEVMQITDWVNNNGADPLTKPATGMYITNSGFSNNILLAKNVRGATGTPGSGGTATGGTKYSQSFLVNRWDDYVNGATDSAIPGGAFGRVYSPVEFTMPNEANLKLCYSFSIQLVGDNSASFDEVRIIAQRSVSPFTSWSSIPGSGTMDVVVTSESHSYVTYQGIDNNTTPGTTYRYRLIAYNIAGTNNRFSSNRGSLFHLTFG